MKAFCRHPRSRIVHKICYRCPQVMMRGPMSIAWARLRAACAFAVVAATVLGPGGTTAHALDAPAPDAKSKAAASNAGATPVSQKPATSAPSKIAPGKAAPGKTVSGKTQAIPQSASRPLPPSPPPPKPTASHPAGWPTNSTSDTSRESHYNRPPPPSAPAPEKPKTPTAQNAADTAADAPPEVEEQYFFQRMIRARTRIMGTDPVDAKRQDRAETADDVRRPASESTKTGDDASKSSGFLSSISALWGGDAPARTAPVQPTAPDAAPAPTPAKTAPAGSEANSLLTKIGTMMPGFLGGSDKK
jgi:hypothetical protein